MNTTTLQWSEHLATGDNRMDETHQEFIEQLNHILSLPHQDQLEPYRKFVAHTQAHFAQEERWMVATGFSSDNCHASHHATIIDTMQAVEKHHLEGDHEIITRMAEAMAEWFPGHAASMDAGLALHMKAVQFDSATEQLADPSRIKDVVMSGCGSVSCSS